MRISETVSQPEEEPTGVLSNQATEVPLTRDAIRAIFERERHKADALFSHWEHPFSGLTFNRARRSYGQAHRDGRVVLSNTFVGTTAFADLEDTIRHELAHLIAGIRYKHGPRWRKVAISLGATPRASGRSESDELHDKMSDAPFTLIAVMQSGEERVIRRVYRRARSYINYRYGKRGQRYHIHGEFVERFLYVDHRNQQR
ncbi:SprT-like domain-containing protein [Congregibacter sp.]|uniref:SprT-like domain-containing protein n=1 Tax=Congregibacter sp. TaxID=2744308 RepID=UPI003F6AE242